MTFEECTVAYNDANAVLTKGIQTRRVDFPELADFNFARRRFMSAVKRGAMHEDWEKASVFFCTVHAKLARTPCSPSWLINHLLNDRGGQQTLKKLQHRVCSVDPSVRESYKELLEGMKRISSIDTNPILTEVLALLPKGFRNNCKILFVLRDLMLWEEFRNSIRHIPDSDLSEIVKPSYLRERQRGDRIFLFGPPWMFSLRNEEYLLRSPAARKIFIIGCAHEFSGEIRLSGFDDSVMIPISGTQKPTSEDDPYSFETLLSNQGGRLVFKRSSVSRVWESGSVIEAVPFKFGNKRGTYLRTDSKVWTVLVNNVGGIPRCAAVEKVDVKDLEPEDLILMTTHGGGDMIPVVADMILPHSKQIRELQSVWKNALIREIERHGIDEVVVRLAHYGATKASAANVRNWANPRSLGMENLDSDLVALLKLIGLESQYTSIVDGIQKLRGAHQSAGAQLQRRLRENLEGQDLRSVFTHGVMEVKHGNGPAKTIFIIEERGVVEEIPEELEGELLEMDE
ncbi:MAG: hypothetical protein PHF70_03065 [Opitutales bacterium]|nr:hypothetical protein [Opitutales bacterium]